MDSWFLAAVAGTKGNEKRLADDPMRKLCLGKLKNAPAQILCIALVQVQAYLINHHLVIGHNNDARWWAWYITDAVASFSMLGGFYFREWRIEKYMHPSIKKSRKDTTEFKKGLPFASFSWIIYVIFIGMRMALIYKKDLETHAEIGNIKITICLTALICVFFTAGHHHRNESLARRCAIILLVKSFTIDLLDTIDILDVLFDTEVQHEMEFPKLLEDIILTLTVLNMVRPAFVLWSLFMDHFASKSQTLGIKIIKCLIELFLINLPLLAIRSYIAVHYDDFISVFLVKNILALLFSFVEIYDCCYERYVEKQDALEGRSKNIDESRKLSMSSSEHKLHEMRELMDEDEQDEVDDDDKSKLNRGGNLHLLEQC